MSSRASKRKAPPRAEASKRQKQDPQTHATQNDLGLIEEDMSALPSYARQTAQGGYAHTSTSRRRIGEANKGKIPWNKGKNRSEESKAKIGMAVRARNAGILSANLEKIGLRHEEYETLKTRLKYVRERVRKNRISYNDRVEAEKEFKEKLDHYLKEGHPEDKEEEEVEVQEIVVEEVVEETDSEEEEDEPEKEQPDGASDHDEDKDSAKPITNKNHMPSVFRKDIIWDANFFDDPNNSYSQFCPTGGPGGLICCATCSALYSQFLLDSHKNLETQQFLQVREEVTTLTQFLSDTNTRLKASVHAASKRPPPPKKKQAPRPPEENKT